MNAKTPSQTTSTKCQYQAAVSNPIWCVVLKPLFMFLQYERIRRAVPTITWKPWSPVSIKKTLP